MAVVKRRGATRQGRTRIAGLHRKDIIALIRSKGQCGANEDMLYSYKYFKDRLQKNRKPVEGNCSICLEVLHRSIPYVTFCRSGCRQNFHNECIQRWKKESGIGSATCPMCRIAWKREEVLDGDAVIAYVNWLYTTKVYDDDHIDRTSDDFFMMLLKAWKVSHAVGDDDFRKAVIAEYFRSTTQHDDQALPLACIKYAFETVDVPSMREFIVQESIETHDTFGVAFGVDDYPPEFTKLLCVDALTRMWEMKTGKRRYHLEKYTDGDYFVDEKQDGEDEEPEKHDNKNKTRTYNLRKRLGMRDGSN